MRSLDRLGASDLIRGGVWVGVSVLGGPIPPVLSDIRWADLPLTGRTRRLAAVAAGLIAAVPVLLLFGSLLSEADPLFGQTMARILAIDLRRLETHVVLTGLIAWAAAGVLRGGFWREGGVPTIPFELDLRVPPGHHAQLPGRHRRALRAVRRVPGAGNSSSARASSRR